MKLATLLLSPKLRVRPEIALFLLLALQLTCGRAETIVTHAMVEQQIRQARYEQALVLTQQALAAQPRDPKFLFWQAWSQEKMGNTQAALSGYQNLIQAHPELPEPHNNLGVLMMRLGDFEGAQLAFQEALRMNAQYPEALENLGDVLLVKTRRLYQQAEKTSGTKMRLQEKIRALPDFPLPASAQP